MGGYPDGLFRGEESLTRYEMAMIAQRILAKLDGSAPVLASADPAAGNGNAQGTPGQPTPAARELVQELADELHAAGADQGEVKAALNLLADAVAEGAPAAEQFALSLTDRVAEEMEIADQAAPLTAELSEMLERMARSPLLAEIASAQTTLRELTFVYQASSLAISQRGAQTMC